jgi:hypothetical protein
MAKRFPEDGEMFFQKDVAQLHTANEILDLLHEHFSNHVSLNCFCQHFGYGWSWSPYSPDFNEPL